jgi:hypothetical protein
MLDEHEYAEIAALYQAGTKSVKDYRIETSTQLKDVPVAKFYASLLARYQEMTGYAETNPNVILHHRLSLYGPPCSKCGKPLRTPRAKICGNCMAPGERERN